MSATGMFDFLNDFQSSSLVTSEALRIVDGSWIVEIEGFGESAAIIGGLIHAQQFSEGKSMVLPAGILSGERYLLDFEVSNAKQLQTYVEAWFVNDLEARTNRQLDLGTRTVDWTALTDSLKKVLPNYRAKLWDSRFSIAGNSFHLSRQGPCGQINDATNGRPLFVSNTGGNELVKSLGGALDGSCLNFSS